MASQERFGYEWDKYHSMDERYEGQFNNWTYPLQKSDFAEKAVLDAGCGMGRNSYWPLLYGAREVVAFDLDDRSVNRARLNLAKFPNFKAELRSIYEIDYKNQFDIAFSIGVIHHLKNPKLAIKNLISSVKPSGRVAIWVYGFEGNEWVVKYVDPIRKNITSKLPVSVVHFLSYFCSVPLWLFVKLFSKTNSYIRQLSTFKFWHLHSIVFDQLIPEVANYWRKSEVVTLFNDLDISELDVHAPPNGNGWIAIATKK